MSARALCIIGLVAIAGCASGTSIATEQSHNITTGGGGFLQVTGSDAPKMSVLKLPLASVWRVLPSIYDSIGVEISELDHTNHIIGNTGLKVRKKLGNRSLSELMDCGNAQGYPSADTYDIQLSIRTQVEARADGGTTMGTIVQAVGRPVAFSGEYVKCLSKGTLEVTIQDALKARLGS